MIRLIEENNTNTDNKRQFFTKLLNIQGVTRYLDSNKNGIVIPQNFSNIVNGLGGKSISNGVVANFDFDDNAESTIESIATICLVLLRQIYNQSEDSSSNQTNDDVSGLGNLFGDSAQ